MVLHCMLYGIVWQYRNALYDMLYGIVWHVVMRYIAWHYWATLSGVIVSHQITSMFPLYGITFWRYCIAWYSINVTLLFGVIA